MKIFRKTTKKHLIIALIALLMITIAILPVINNKNSALDSSKATLSSDPWNGRGSNYIDGTGFNDPSSIGSNLSEPTTWTETWVEHSGFNAYNTSSMFTNLLNNTTKAQGNFRKNASNQNLYVADNPTIGQSASNPWIIDGEKEFTFFARMIQLAYSSSTNNCDAYFSRPYFKLSGDIDLAGYRWTPPRFYYSYSTSTNYSTFTISNVTYKNRIYFDGGKYIDGVLVGNYTIKNAYVSQLDNSTSFMSTPSIFGNIPMKSIIKNVNIENAYVTVPSGTSEISIVCQTSGTECVFENISVKKSTLSGYGNMNGIAANASLIKNCKITNTTLISNPTATAYIRGIGQASEFKGNEVINTNIQADNPASVYMTGIGQVRVVPAYNSSNGTGYDRLVGEWTTETEVDNTSGKTFKGGFYNNIVKNSKIASVGGTSSGYVMGIGRVAVVAPATFEGNTVENSKISISSDNNISSTSMAYGMGYITEAEPDIQISDNAVISSTVSVETKLHTSYASGMFNIADKGAEIRRCYTENTNVIAKINGTTGTSYVYTAGISIGYANLFEDCITGSGNIEARAVGGYIYAYGIGSTFGISATAGPSNRKNWSNDAANVDGWWNLSETEKGAYLGDKPVTEFKNCYNFSNITTQSTGVIYAAGIGMGEGFTNCVNYGNIIGNQIGGIAYGFVDATEGTPGTAEGNTATRTGAIHPLIIKNCANFGNMIRAANGQTSYIGGIFSRYETLRNYRKVRRENNGMIDVVDNIDGKHLEIENCIIDGKFYFYTPVDTSGETEYKLTDNFGGVSHNNNYWGVIFGALNLRAYTFQDISTEANEINTAKFDNFINQRFKLLNNSCNTKSAFDFMNLITTSTGTKSKASENLSEHDNILNVPATSWRQTIYGPTISSLNVRTDYVGIGSTAMTDRLAYNVWSSIVKNWKDSLTPYNSYDYFNGSAVWNVSSGIPQIPNAEFPFQILAYDRSDATQGYVPNVSIKRHTGDDIGFTIENYINPETGMSVDRWRLGGTTDKYYDADAGIIQTIPRNNLPIIMLFADIQIIEFTVKTIDGADGYGYTVISTTVEKNGSIEIEVTYNPINTVEVKNIVWWVQDKNDDWWRISTSDFSGDAPYTHKLIMNVDETFIFNYGQGNYEQGRSFVLKAEFGIDPIYKCEIKLTDAFPNITGIKLFVDGSEYSKDTQNVNITKNAEVRLAAEYDTILYNFVEFTIKGASGCYEVITNTIYSPTVIIKITNTIESISFKLAAREYDIAIQLVSLSLNSKTQLDNDKLINMNSADLEKAAYIGAKPTGFSVVSIYEDVVENCFYKFVRWELANGTSISDINAINITPTMLSNNLRVINDEDEKLFVIVAVFQRQVELIINMKENMGFNNNYYTIFWGDKEFNSADGRVIIDIGALVSVKFSPDSRLEIDEINDEKASENKDYINNILFLVLDISKRIDVTFIPRPAKINLTNNKAHEGTDVRDGGLGVVFLNDLVGVNVLTGVEHGATFKITLDLETAAKQCRFIGLKIKNVLTNEFDTLNYNFSGSGNFAVIADDSFFHNYVDTNGNCEIRVFVALVYEVKISAENFTRENGTYNYKDAFGNSFTLEFDKAAAAIVSETNLNSFIIDHGVNIKYTYNSGFGKFYYVNIGEEEKVNQSIPITSTRQIGFLANQYKLNVSQTGKSNASIDSYTENFGVGSVITIACTVKSAYQINKMTINGKTLSELGAVRKGNTITINVTPEFIEAVNAELKKDVGISMKIDTGLSSLIMFGGIGGGIALIILVLLTIFLVIRSKRINEKRKAAEALAREYEQRFNIGNLVDELRKMD